jgi:hypothetical protein
MAPGAQIMGPPDLLEDEILYGPVRPQEGAEIIWRNGIHNPIIQLEIGEMQIEVEKSSASPGTGWHDSSA